MAHTETSESLRADRRFVKSAMAVPLLDADHERDLARRWREQNDNNALHELTTAYMRLVVSMAGKFRNYGLPMADLVQEGNIGLMQAAARFEPDREVRFSTYASWWIRASIQDYVLRNWSIVRTGTTAAQKSLFFNLRRLRAGLNDGGSQGLSPESRAFIAKELSVEEREVEMMASRLSASDRSLNAPLVEAGEGEWQDFLVDEAPLPEAAVMHSRDDATRHQWLETALATLTAREHHIIEQRRLIDEPQTLECMGKALGISKERVRQIEHHALKKLKAALEGAVGDPRAAGLID
jgi:RNA polymerase sigma-32 factor